MKHNIAGPLCFSGDVVKRDILLPVVNLKLTLSFIIIILLLSMIKNAVLSKCL